MNRGWVWPVREAARVNLGSDSCVDLVRTCLDAGLFSSRRAWLYAWNEFDILLPQVLPGFPPDPSGWDRLSIFSSTAELRFVGRGGEHFAWLLAEDETLMHTVGRVLAPRWELVPSRSFLVRETRRVLVGKREGAGWREVRFPRILQYDPGFAVDGERLWVRALEYLEDWSPGEVASGGQEVPGLAVRLVTVRYAEFGRGGLTEGVEPYGSGDA
ncbi:MAG: hypothetical protein QME87_11600 [Bacillota bacterium]|nr:hypothetical protein [Bacillota bacterium]